MDPTDRSHPIHAHIFSSPSHMHISYISCTRTCIYIHIYAHIYILCIQAILRIKVPPKTSPHELLRINIHTCIRICHIYNTYARTYIIYIQVILRIKVPPKSNAHINGQVSLSNSSFLNCLRKTTTI